MWISTSSCWLWFFFSFCFVVFVWPLPSSSALYSHWIKRLKVSNAPRSQLTRKLSIGRKNPLFWYSNSDDSLDLLLAPAQTVIQSSNEPNKLYDIQTWVQKKQKNNNNNNKMKVMNNNTEWSSISKQTPAWLQPFQLDSFTLTLLFFVVVFHLNANVYRCGMWMNIRLKLSKNFK